jgi:hypothetical protein
MRDVGALVIHQLDRAGTCSVFVRPAPEVKAITRNLGQEEVGSNHQQLIKVENREGYKVASGAVDSQDHGLPVHRSRQYYFSENPVYATERFGAKVTPEEAEYNVTQAMSLAQYLCKEVDFNMPLKAFLLPPGHPVLRQAMQAALSRVEGRKARQGSKSTRSKIKSADFAEDDDDADCPDGDVMEALSTGKAKKEPWPKMHTRMWKDKLNIDWDASMPTRIPTRYKDCVLFEELKLRDRDQLMFFDELQPCKEESLGGDELIDLSFPEQALLQSPRHFG